MAKGAEPQVMVARESFVGGLGKETLYITEGELFGADDPAVRKWPALFKPVTLRTSIEEPRIEQATAAPGEKRP